MDGDLRRRESFKCNKMKLYLVRISPCCRIVWLYCLRNDLPVDLVDVDVFGGEHRSPEFLKLNPNGEVPVLVDEDTIVYEAVPILLYLAEKYTKFNSFGETEKDQAMVKSILGWSTTELHNTLGYRLVYPNFMEACQLGEDATESLVEKGTVEITKHLEMIENNFLCETKFVVGDAPTVADCYLATILVQLEWIQFDFSLWRKLHLWLGTMKQVKGWDQVHEKHYGFVKKLEE